MRRLGCLALACTVAVALAPGSALAKHSRHHHRKPPAAVQQVLNYCTSHNQITQHYPLSVLEQALQDLSTDAREYSICAQEIQNAIQVELGGPRRPPPRASAAVRKKVLQHAGSELNQAQQAGQKPVSLGGAKIVAGAVQVNGSSLLGALPTSVLVVLVALVALGAVPLALRLASIVRARRTR